MKGTNGISTVAVTLFFVLLGLSLSLSTVQAQWTRLGLDEGGVGEDVQLLRLEDNSLGDVVWSANMEGGLFRAAHSSGAWQSWTEYLPGRFMFGVEAICDEDTEHVLAATGTLGIWYAENPTPSSDWDPPNGYDYPDEWKNVWTHDAAFFCNTDGNWPDTPPDSFFVILRDTIGDPVQFKPGIYRWLEPDDDFKRVDAALPTSNSRGFGHFWRDLSIPNVLYSIMGPGTGYNGGLCKISGDYADPDFELVTIVPSGQGTLKEVLGFNQWEYGSDIYSYALVLRSVGGDDSYDVWFSTNLAGSSPSFTHLTNLNSVYFTSYEDDWSNAFTLPFGGKIIGKPYEYLGQTYHKLWITSANGDNGVMYGVLYKDTYYPNDPPIQVNGDDEEGCKTWADRAFTPDPGHLGSSTMRFFMGTHKHGVWYMSFSTSNEPTWTHLGDGYMGIDNRGGFKLYDNGNLTEILMPGWNTGIFRYNGDEWVERGIFGLDGNSYHTDPAFRHGNYSACMIWNEL
jgi:hypothetical protein